ncbi:hypothetical protein MF406_11285 [Georgenia sp. TF02-10]|uniref:hypothetical protein n=1 Tax=Georgenia sp. TF02-10 TaxID=2917725 RepID=UPI001FA6BD56|nr:hypothetical protein [Georgenia sp. TF02-10]UNX53571.1 hypothetical protein MF406_11285 [Georgenia sp. TF02-10]
MMTRSSAGSGAPDERHHSPEEVHAVPVAAEDSHRTGYATEIERLDRLIEDATLHRQLLVLRAGTQLLTQVHSDLASFSVVHDRDVWKVVAAADQHGQPIAVSEATFATLNDFFAERGLVDADSHAGPVALQVDVHRETDAARPERRFIDVAALDETDFDAVIESAHDRLDLTEPGRTRRDFTVQIRDGFTFQGGLTDDEVQQATELAIRYYRRIISAGGGAVDVEAESFHEAIGIAARELLLEDDADDHHREPLSGRSRPLE